MIIILGEANAEVGNDAGADPSVMIRFPDADLTGKRKV